MAESTPGTAVPASYRIAVLTLAGSTYGHHLLRSLAAHGHRPALVVVLDNPLSRKVRLLRSVARRIGWRDGLLYAVDETLSPTQPSSAPRGSWPGYDKVADAVVHVPVVSTPVAANQLRRHDIDVLLLGQSGIVPQSILDAPKVGTLNAHPGWLPDFKGIDCAAWTILAGRSSGVPSTGLMREWTPAASSDSDSIAGEEMRRSVHSKPVSTTTASNSSSTPRAISNAARSRRTTTSAVRSIARCVAPIGRERPGS